MLTAVRATAANLAVTAAAAATIVAPAAAITAIAAAITGAAVAIMAIAAAITGAAVAIMAIAAAIIVAPAVAITAIAAVTIVAPAVAITATAAATIGAAVAITATAVAIIGAAAAIMAIAAATIAARVMVIVAGITGQALILIRTVAMAGALTVMAMDRAAGVYHNIFHYNRGYNPLGWLYVSYGYDLYSRSYLRDCEVVSQSFSRRGRRYEDVALLCYDQWGYGYIKRGSQRTYRQY